MHPIMTNIAALAVASLFYLWRAHHQTRERHQRVLCERVAYMLWVVAEQVQGSDSGLSVACRG